MREKTALFRTCFSCRRDEPEADFRIAVNRDCLSAIKRQQTAKIM
jgi:hypothetical protein